jgi:hypothetical protein
MRAEADRCRDNDVEAISRPGQVLHRGLQLPGLSFKVRHDVEVVVAAEHGKPVLQREGRAGSRTHSLRSRAIAAKYELEFLRANKQYPILAEFGHWSGLAVRRPTPSFQRSTLSSSVSCLAAMVVPFFS